MVPIPGANSPAGNTSTSSAVNTANTPRAAAAAPVSMDVTVAWATGDRTNTTHVRSSMSTPSSSAPRSAPKVASPVTKRRALGLGRDKPTASGVGAEDCRWFTREH